MKINRIAALSVLTAAALIIHIAEAQIPPLIAVPGIKPGLSNVIVLVTMYLFGRRDAFVVLILKVGLGGIFAGQLMSLLYSASGGLLCFLVSAVLYKILRERQIWALSAFGAIFHNIGQLTAAVFILGSRQLLWYAPVLVISGIISGLFTGICAQLLVSKLRKFTNK